MCVMKVFEGVDHYFENGFGGLHGDEEFCPALTHEKHKQRLQSRTTEYNLVLTSTTLCLMKGKGTLLMHGALLGCLFSQCVLVAPLSRRFSAALLWSLRDRMGFVTLGNFLGALGCGCLSCYGPSWALLGYSGPFWAVLGSPGPF